ncbi:hypothetical protein [Polyangium fumosum]|uniref:Uncharacterized protein n=1 Tax=Polyangium fumosum TaxID=889272 RepID=A0A4U1IKY9_9BACT|nr:hypothetical protein [Polyangium fumosum]TKC94656.1 hypothetical protein E8A74_48035 [Polyangium fumosum]
MSRNNALPLFTAAALLFLATGCDRCTPKDKDTKADAGPPAPIPIPKDELLPPPAPWVFKPARIGPGIPGIALPTGCEMRAPLVRAKVAPSTRFVAAPRGIGTLVVADADEQETPPRLLGVAGLVLDAEGESKGATPLPWLDADAMPRLARTDAGVWLAAYSEQGEDKLSRGFVHQGDHATPIGEGDRFDALDLACGSSRCALLTTRLGNVAVAGAALWVGLPNEPASSWKRTEIVPDTPESDARPSCIARLEAPPPGSDAGAGGGVVAALLEGQELVFWEATDGAARSLGRVPAPFGIVDATVAARPIALVYGATIDEEGCAKEGGKLRFERVGKEAAEVRAHAPPVSGALRPLERGVLAAYLAPLGCGVARKVAYAVVLDAEGTPVSAPMPVADATSFAVAARGADVDMWIQMGDEVSWVRATCAAP